MTTLYRPVQVLNDAQRAALPEGSFMHPNCYLGGILTYLVPIEAEEEWAAEFDSGELYMNLDQDSARDADGGAAMSRLVTPWEQA